MHYSHGRLAFLCRKVNEAWDKMQSSVGHRGYTQWAARINWCVKHQVITAKEANFLMKYDGGWNNRVGAGKGMRRDYHNRVGAGKGMRRDYHKAVRRTWKQNPYADYGGRVRDKAICRTSSEVKYRGD